MQLPVTPSRLVPAILAHGPDGLGERVVETLLTLYDQTGAPFQAFLRAAATNEHAATLLREFLTTEILGRVAVAAATPDQPELRAALAASQILGLVMARYIVCVPHIADADRSHLAACVGPSIQRYLTATLPEPPAPP